MAGQDNATPGAVTPPVPVSESEKRNRQLLAEVESFTVDSWEKHTVAGTLIARAAQREREVHKETDETCEKAHAAWKAATALRTRLLATPKTIRTILAQKMGQFERAQREIEARRQREERERAQREADERRLAEAERAEKRGDKMLSEALVEDIGKPAPPMATPSTTPPVQRHHEGSTVQIPSIWKARPRAGIEPDEALRQLVVEAAKDWARYGKYVGADMSALNAQAKLDKDTFQVPGFESFEDFSSRVRG